MNLRELRNYFYKHKDYIIRIRKDSPDIVYYHGNKAFVILKKDKKCDYDRIKLIPNIFLINDATIKKFEKSKTSNINLKEIVVETLSDMRNSVKDLMYIKDDARIKLEKSTSRTFDKDEVQDNLYNILNTFSYNKYFIKQGDNLILNKNHPEDLTNLEYDIFYAFVRDDKNKKFKTRNGMRNGWRKPKFDLYDFKEIPISNLTIKQNKELVLMSDITNINVNKAIEQYEKIAYEEEKNYQYLFMIDEDTINSKHEDFKNIIHFEQEYYNYEKGYNKPIYDGIEDKKVKRGRIDTVFLNINAKKEGDIYFIELKYNDNVLGGSNGIHEHLIDMVKVLKNNDQKFKENLIKRVKYRFQELDIKKELEYIKKINFWIVIGYEESKKENIKKILEDFNNVKNFEYIKKKYKLPEHSKPIVKHIKELKDLDCNVHIFLDKTNSRDNNNNYISLTNEPFEEYKY